MIPKFSISIYSAIAVVLVACGSPTPDSVSSAPNMVGAYCASDSAEMIVFGASSEGADHNSQPDLIMEVAGQRIPILTAYSYFGNIQEPPPDFVMGLIPIDDQTNMDDVLVFQNKDGVWLTYQDERYRPCETFDQDVNQASSLTSVWTLSKHATESEQDFDASFCTLHEANASAFSLEVTFYTLDAKPPFNYPTVRLVRALGPTVPMAMSGEAEVATWDFDSGEVLQTRMTHDYVEERNQFDLAFEDTQPVLAKLVEAERLSIDHESLGQLDYIVSGFAKAYADMADACDFDTVGVLDD